MPAGSVNRKIIDTAKAPVHVVYATDTNFFIPTLVSIFTLAENSDPSRQYDIRVIVTADVNNSQRELLTRMSRIFKNIIVSSFEAEALDLIATLPYISEATYYRLFLQDYFPELDKCVWLDGDTAVCGDIGKMYDAELGGNYIAGVPALMYRLDEEFHKQRMNLAGVTQCINAGSIVLNLKMIRDNNMGQIFDNLARKQYETQDQDALNIACHGRIAILPCECNFTFKRIFEHDASVFDIYGAGNMRKAFNNPLVIHFLTKYKPWKGLKYDYQNRWNEYFSEAKKHFPEIAEFCPNTGECSDSFLTFEEIRNADRLIFYGAGIRAKRLIEIIEKLDCRMPDVIWDRKANQIKSVHGIKAEFPILQPKERQNDIIIVCILDCELSDSVVSELINNGYGKTYSADDYANAAWNYWAQAGSFK